MRGWEMGGGWEMGNSVNTFAQKDLVGLTRR